MLTFKYVSVVRVLVLFHFGWSGRFMMRNIFNVKFLPFFVFLHFFLYNFDWHLFLNSSNFLFKFIPLFLLKHHWVGIVFLSNVSTTRFSHTFLVKRKFLLWDVYQGLTLLCLKFSYIPITGITFDSDVFRAFEVYHFFGKWRYEEGHITTIWES